jgi:hypothetical protein
LAEFLLAHKSGDPLVMILFIDVGLIWSVVLQKPFPTKNMLGPFIFEPAFLHHFSLVNERQTETEKQVTFNRLPFFCVWFGTAFSTASNSFGTYLLRSAHVS